MPPPVVQICHVSGRYRCKRDGGGYILRFMFLWRTLGTTLSRRAICPFMQALSLVGSHYRPPGWPSWLSKTSTSGIQCGSRLPGVEWPPKQEGSDNSEPPVYQWNGRRGADPVRPMGVPPSHTFYPPPNLRAIINCTEMLKTEHPQVKYSHYLTVVCKHNFNYIKSCPKVTMWQRPAMYLAELQISL